MPWQEISIIEARKQAPKAITRAAKELPTLSISGFDGSVRDKNDIYALNPERVAVAMLFLSMACKPTRKPAYGSYGLKHCAERWGKAVGLAPYIANGELIAAANHLGLQIRQRPTGPNADIGCKPLSGSN